MIPTLTVQSFGGGQDSSTIERMIATNRQFRDQFVKGRYLVLMADTGNEHPYTYEHVNEVKARCKASGIEFHFITNDMGYHSDKWPDLCGFYERTRTCGSKAFFKTCTDNLKIKVIYRFLEAWIEREYGYRAGRKRGIKEFANQHEKIDMLIGFARGEEGRVGKNKNRPKWMQNSINFVYPLIEIGYSRQDCIDYLAPHYDYQVLPSNCMICPYLDDVELIWLERNHPEMFRTWCRFEQQKLDKFVDTGDRNLGVWGKYDFPLEAVLGRAIEKHGYMTDAELDEYKLSHGHCIRSKY